MSEPGIYINYKCCTCNVEKIRGIDAALGDGYFLEQDRHGYVGDYIKNGTYEAEEECECGAHNRVTVLVLNGYVIRVTKVEKIEWDSDYGFYCLADDVIDEFDSLGIGKLTDDF